MKYSNTPRVLNLIFHTILCAAFACLGIYFSFFVTPFYFTTIKGIYSAGVPNGLNLYLILGSTGLTIMALSGYGVKTAIDSLKDPSNDEAVVKGFTAFLAEGGLMSAFFLAFATLFFELAAPNNGNITFVIVMSVIFALILLIATNIPMVKLYDGKDQRPLVTAFTNAGGLFFGATSLQLLIAYIASLARGSYSCSPVINPILLILFLGTLLTSVCAFVSSYLLNKKSIKQTGNEADKTAKLAGYLISIAMIIIAILMIGFGTYYITINSTMDIHFNYFDGVYQGTTFPIMLIVMGSLLAISSIVVGFVNFKEITEVKPKKHNK